MGTADRRGSGKATVFGALVGGLLGVGVGLLIAPEEGHRLRRRLSFQLDRLAEGVERAIERIGASPDESDASRTGRALVQDARHQADQIMHDVDALIDEMRRSAR